nr:hypothetical protein [Saccharomonospora saliphila]
MKGAAPVGAPRQPPAVGAEPEVLCTLDDDRLDEVSGLAVDGATRYVVNDGGTRVEVFALGEDCQVREVLRHPTDPYDVEALAVGPDGTVWLGDTGDNRSRRETVALHAVTPGGEATLYRLTYPDGPHDAEALIVDGSGVPYVITKDVLGDAGVYRPTGELTSPGPTPLERVGGLSYTATDTPGGPLGSIGSLAVTGAALSADGSVLAVRTYTDAYLYPVPDGDVVAALDRRPARIALPGEDQGEAVAFAPDGALLSVSEGVGSPLRSVAGAVDVVDGPGAADGAETAPQAPADAAEDTAGDGEGSGDSGAGLDTLPGIAVAVALAAVLVIGAGRLRRR